MAFATVADIQTILPFKFTSSSSPTESQVIELIQMHSAHLSLLLRSKGVQDPQEGTTAYEYCKMIVMYETAADILNRIAAEKGQDGSNQAVVFERKASELKQLLVDNPQAFT